MEKDYKCGFVVIAGKPNVGKSTLLNNLIGTKLSIVSPKPQTTRLALKGIYTDNEKQIVFLDTPGYLKPRYEMQKRMLKQILDYLNSTDVVLFLSDNSTFPTDYDFELLEVVKQVKKPKLAVINKSDLPVKQSRELTISMLKPDFDDILFISALKGDNLDAVIPAIAKLLPYGPALYEPDQLSDLPMRFFAQEAIREAVFNFYSQEIPYATAVLIDKYEEFPERDVISATIWIERESQKPILIGKGGNGLKRIRETAGKEITILTGKPAEVHLWVKVKKNWRKNNSALQELGLT